MIRHSSKVIRNSSAKSWLYTIQVYLNKLAKILILLNRVCKTKATSFTIPSGGFIEDFDLVRSELVSTRQERLFQGVYIAASSGGAVGVPKICVRPGV